MLVFCVVLSVINHTFIKSWKCGLVVKCSLFDLQSIFNRSSSVIHQVRSECLTCTFRASCCSARLSRAQVPDSAGSSVRVRGEKVGGSKWGPPALAGTREYEQSDRNREQAEGGLRCCGIWNVT